MKTRDEANRWNDDRVFDSKGKKVIEEREEPQFPVASNLPPAPRVLQNGRRGTPPSCYFARSPSFSLSFTHAYVLFLLVIHIITFSRSLFLSLTHTTRIRPSASVLVRVKSPACAQHARAHARHSPKSILYVSRCTKALLPPSPLQPSRPPLLPPAPPAAYCSCRRCVMVSSPITNESREKIANVDNGLPFFSPFLLCEDPFSVWQRDHPSLLEDRLLRS